MYAHEHAYADRSMTERIPMSSTLSAPAAHAGQGAGHKPLPMGSAHAKAILLGEHAAVYGAPAIAVPLHELRAEAAILPSAVPGVHLVSDLYTGDASDAPAAIQPVVAAVHASFAGIPADPASGGVEIRIASGIPHERGLGSSAAVAAAVARAVAAFTGRPLSADRCHEIVQTAERVAHGNPSGLDARAVVADGVIRFERGAATELPIGAPVSVVVADSGVYGSTGVAVGSVRGRRDTDPQGVDALIARLADATLAGIDDLASGDLTALGRRMSDAHDVLVDLGVSGTMLDSLVAAARSAGALGAKLTGGGLGGCVLALAETPEHAERLASALRGAGAPRTWITTVPAA